MDDPAKSTPGRRLLVFDRTCRGLRHNRALSRCWQLGGWLYRGLGRLDAAFGAASWPEALDWLASSEQSDLISEIQFWGHGKWGQAKIAGEVIDRGVLATAHGWQARLAAIRERLAPDALWWFRTCETLGARAGHDFAAAWADYFGSRVAGHTYVIAFYQSGLHLLAPGCRPHWSEAEGLAEGGPGAPRRAQWSRASAPNTITCLQGRVPAGW